MSGSTGAGPARRRSTGAMPARRRPVETDAPDTEGPESTSPGPEILEPEMVEAAYDEAADGEAGYDEAAYDQGRDDEDSGVDDGSGADFSEDADDGTAAPVKAKAGRKDRLARTGTRADTPAPRAAAGAPARKGLLDRSKIVLDTREQWAAYLLGTATAVVAAVGYLPLGIRSGHKDSTGLAIMGIVAGALLVGAARTRKRVPTAITALLANFVPPAFRWSSFLSFACVVLGGIIILRTSNERARQAGEERRRRREEEKAAGGVRGGRPAPSARGRGRGGATTATKGPAPNKRYTPPKAKPKPRTPPPAPAKGKKGATSDEL